LTLAHIPDPFESILKRSKFKLSNLLVPGIPLKIFFIAVKTALQK
jgi:hypothetical protein